MTIGILLMIFGVILLIMVQVIFGIRLKKLKKKWDDDNEMS